MEDRSILERFPQENDKQWLAFTCFKDLGLSRSMDNAYNVYLSHTQPKNAGKGRKEPSSDFKKWRQVYHWDERVRLHDADQEKNQATLQYDLDTEFFVEGIKRFRSKAEKIAVQQLDAIEKAQQLLINNLETIAERSSESGELSRLDLDTIQGILRSLKDSSVVAEQASKRMSEAYQIKVLLADQEGMLAGE